MASLRDIMTAVGGRCPGGALPESYLVLDLETSGLDWQGREGPPAVIVQFGFAVVQNCQLTENMAIYVKRPEGTMSEGATAVTGITDEMLMEKGVEPSVVFPQIIRLLNVYRSAGLMFMGHNLVSFDAPFFSAECKRQGYDFEISPSECLDTGVIFKAARLRLSPGPHETLPGYLTRIREIRSHTKWNLKLATQMLNVDRTHGLDLDKAHDAGFDCLATHLLFETMRRTPEL